MKTDEKKSKLKLQKLIGLALIIMGVISISITNDGTVAIFLIPYGAHAFFAKCYILNL